MPERESTPDPFALPPEIVEAIQDDEYACVTIATEEGTALLAKIPSMDIEDLHGTYPVQVRHELLGHPASPVIRITATLYDDPQRPFLLETFINPDDPHQRADYAALAGQEDLRLYFYDEIHQFRLAKAVVNRARERIPLVLETADALLASIPPEDRDFDRAKADVMAAIRLNGDDSGANRGM